jgi:precorrin-6B methylase 2
MRRLYVLARRLLTYVLFERPSGIQTGRVVQLEELGLDAPHRVRHQPSGWLNLRRILRKSEVSEDDVFIDFGSGMGRVVFQAAADYPFKRVIGVELSSELNDIAKANVRAARRRLRCRHIELVRSDALDYELPDDVSIAYFNNPFTGEIFEAVLQKIVASLERNPRPFRIIYANPSEEEMLLDAGAILVRKVRGWRPSRKWSESNAIRMYELEARQTRALRASTLAT